MSIDEFLTSMRPALFEVMNSRGQMGHCILIARVLDQLFEQAGVASEPICLDYEVCNSVATNHLNSGGAIEDAPQGAQVVQTGLPGSLGFPHHVVTLIPSGGSALLLDPTIIQVNRLLRGDAISMIELELAYPVPREQRIEVNGCRITYSFLPKENSFKLNSQWKNALQAKSTAKQILRLMGFKRK